MPQTLNGIHPLLSCQYWQFIPEQSFEFQPLQPERRSMPLVQELRHALLPRIVDDARESGRLLFNEEGVDIRSIEVGPTGAMTLTPARMEYFDHVVAGANLDRLAPLSVDPRTRPLRHLLGGDPRSLEDIAALGSPAKMGVSCTALTADGHLVQGVRSSRSAPLGTPDARQALQPITEGASPEDLNPDTGRIDPAVGARRGLLEELNVTPELTRWLGPIGMYFDMTRWQVCFAYLAQLEVTMTQLRHHHGSAADSWENTMLVGFPPDEEARALCHLLEDTHPLYTLSSNHSAAAAWCAACWLHGPDRMGRLLLDDYRRTASPAAA